MHEFGLAENILNNLSEIKKKEGLEKIIKVKLRSGSLLQIVPETLKFAFETIASDTEFKDTVFELFIEPMKLVCNDCGKIETLEKDRYYCSGCKSENVRISGTKDFIIESIEV